MFVIFTNDTKVKHMYSIIVNPFSGNGKSEKCLPEVEALLKARKIEYRVCHTEKPHDAYTYAHNAVLNHEEGVIVLGGDGSMSEVIRAMSGCNSTLLFVPCGTGNDFLKTLKLPKKPIQALEKQLDSPVHRIDCAIVNDKAFVNVAGTGFDADVLKKLDKYKARYRGLAAYLRALADALGNYRPKSFRISIDGSPFEERLLCILSVGNGRYIGGGMKAVPDARIDDGLLNLYTIKGIKKCFIPFLLPLFILGLHKYLPIAKKHMVKNVVIEAQEMTFQLDGELIDLERADIQIQPESICVRY